MIRRKKPIGLLTITDNVSPEKLAAFKKDWLAAMNQKGIFPIIRSSTPVKFIPLKSPKRARFLLYCKSFHKSDN